MDDALWNAPRSRQKQISEIFGPNPANTLEGRMKRVHLANGPVHLLSGLLTCGCCGGKVGIITPNRYACLNHHRRGTCDNGRSITRDKIEARVLTGLKERLMSSEAVAEAVRAYAEEMNRLNRDRRAQAATDQKVLAKIEKAIAGIIAAIEDGMYQPSMKARMDDLERQKAEIVARLAQAPADMPDIHPNLADLYRRRVERLSEVLSDPDGGRQAAEALRSLIGEIVLTPGAKRGEVHATLCGELFGILDFAKAEETSRPAGFMPAVEAGPATTDTDTPVAIAAGVVVCAIVPTAWRSIQFRIVLSSPYNIASISPRCGPGRRTIFSIKVRKTYAASVRFSGRFGASVRRATLPA
ncbi:zinc ribbon domain-containing protein [Rhizobium sp. YS-1r]|uniref:zinc ribbon domain-containing protein n=1 Tax=Rhizobium sp. YS-1r TaxID=1532558 RepID=UPI000A64E4D0|nr:zinc ribbon domain-containing protein [Rhizobium sp. YS-1r]